MTQQILEKEINKSIDQISTIELVDMIIRYADHLGASDIHIDPKADHVRLRLRIDGVLRPGPNLPKDIQEEIISRIKILSGMRTDEQQAAQDGRFRALHDGRAVDVRVSVVPSYYGQNAVLRLLSSNTGNYSIDALGLNKENRAKIESALKRPNGLILVTGPTGSGKTSTLYALLKEVKSPDRSVITIEDPIEYAIDDIEQIQVNARTGLTFANGFRAILRQDPNIIMVGEIRDEETAQLAVTSALTGHLIFSTLHTSDAATNLPRLLEMGIEPYLIASTISVVVGQRLLRKICPQCKTEKKFSGQELNELQRMFATENGEITQAYEGAGCKACNGSGYQGRIGVHEVLPITDAIRNAILRKAAAKEIKAIAREEGMRTMLQDGMEKVKEGKTTVAEVIRALYE